VTPFELAIAGGAGFVAGAVNAVAGGGTLLSFPVLIALGLPPVSANVTNTVALSPGYLGGVLSQREQLEEQRGRVRLLVPAAAAGGLAGSVLLLVTSDSAFRNLIPVLLLAATLLLAGQDRLRRRLRIGEQVEEGAVDPRWLPLPVLAVSVYGGYFGAGLGIMLLAVLGTVLHDDLKHLNAVKQVLALAINATAALFFVTSDRVVWSAAGVMAATSLLGGAGGGRLAGRVRPIVLRRIVVAVGLSVAVGYGIKTWG
jgi:uncharacterized membrane protein YfcA